MKQLMSVEWDTEINLIVVKERCFFYSNDIHRFALILARNLHIPLTRYKVFIAKDGFLLWYPEDEVLKYIVDVVSGAIALFKCKVLNAYSYKWIVSNKILTEFRDDEDLLYFIKNRVLLPLKRRERIKITTDEYVKNLKEIHKIIDYQKSMQDRFIELGLTFLKGLKDGSITLNPEQAKKVKALSEYEVACYAVKEHFLKFIAGKKITTETLTDLLIEFFEREVEKITPEEEESFVSNKRVCINCNVEFIPKKGKTALFCQSCRLTAKPKIQKRIQRHKDRKKIKALLDKLKDVDLDDQRMQIKEIKKTYASIFF